MEGRRHVWVRAETKEFEERTPLTPKACKTLLARDPQWKVTVERSALRVFKDHEYEEVGCEMVDQGTWETLCPKDAFILGIKELPEGDEPLRHTHIYFGHCYKGQDGWDTLLSRFSAGGGILLDVEFMLDKEGKRAVAVFGPYAGFLGSALAIDIWCHQKLHQNEEYPALTPFSSADDFISSIKGKIKQVFENSKLDPSDLASYPKVMVIGALGRCGTGAVDAAEKIGIPGDRVTKWDLAETPKSGPIAELLEYDILVNCIFVDPNAESSPLFVTKELIEQGGTNRKLTVISDVSCDASNPKNPLPIYEGITTFSKPTTRVATNPGTLPMDVIAIDHLPSLLPRESSIAFSKKIFPYILDLPNWESSDVWKSAKEAFDENILKLEDKEKSLVRRSNCLVL